MLPSIPLTQRTWKCDYLGKTLTIKAFNIGLQSILLQNKDDVPEEHKNDAIRQVVQACLVDDIDVNDIPSFVIEKIFLIAREISIGETITLNYTCTHKGDDGEECGGKVPLEIALADVNIKQGDDHTDTVELGGGWFMKLRYPCLGMTVDSKTETAEALIARFFDSVYNDAEVHERRDYSERQLAEWIAGLGVNVHLDVMNRFFKTMPRIGYEESCVCEKCGYQHDIKITSLNQLFR